MPKFVLSIDQGTTGTTVLAIDRELRVLGRHTIEYPQIYPQPGWVEHNPEDIWQSLLRAVALVLTETGLDARQDLVAIGITNQRETSLIWERLSLRPVHNAIVWQCRRSAPLCEKLKNEGLEAQIQATTGLLLDPYFSASKVNWLLTNVPGLRARARAGEVVWGTIDSFLINRLSAGQAHVTDVSNASRTMLMDLKTLSWDAEMLRIFDIPAAILPEIKPSSGIFGYTQNVPLLPDGVPIAGVAGDQQAALFGQCCFADGEAKCTYGTGSFLLMNTGSSLVVSKNRLLTTVAWQLGNQPPKYALEGSSFIAGAAVQWLRDNLGIIRSSAEIEELANQVPDSQGVMFVPALAGLGAPHWRSSARGLITGIDRSINKCHIARATLEGIALQQWDLLAAMEKDSGKKLKALKVDGGASKNDLLMQFQADILGVDLIRPLMVETTAFGAGILAGLGTGFWSDLRDVEKTWKIDKRFVPQMPAEKVASYLQNWQIAVAKA
jgi:glycerol kinase